MAALVVDLIPSGLAVRLGADLDAAAPITQLVLDKISVPANVAYSCCRKLRGAYVGPCLRVRRSSDSSELDIGFVDDVLDTAALLAFAGAGSAYVRTLYDQSSNGRNVLQATVGWQPRIVNAGVLDAYPSGKIAMVFDGVDDRLRRTVAGNSCGLSGNPDFTAAAVFMCTGTNSATPLACGSNTTVNGSKATMWRSPGNGVLHCSFYGTARAFTLPADERAAGHGYVMQHPAGTTTHTATMRQDGVSIALGGTTGTAVAVNLPDDNLELGTETTSGAVFMVGRLSCAMLFNAVLAGADLTALETELGAHR